MDYFGVQLAPARKASYSRPKFISEYEWIDNAGRVMKFSPISEGHPIAVKEIDLTLEGLDNLSPIDDSQFESIEYAVKELGKTHFILARLPRGTFPYDSVGMEEFLVRMALEPEFVEKAVEIYTRRSIQVIKKMAQIGVDAVSDGDDYCDNRGPIMGLEKFKQFIYSGLKKVVKAAHDENLYFIKHSDGNQFPILDLFIEAGVDGWQGIQPKIGMDFKILKEKFGSKMCFFGGVDCDTLVRGTQEEVRAEVKYAIENAGENGGLVITSSNTLMVGVQYENVMEMIRATREFGKYPLQK